jgi:predicted AAA+ superfamily ATPase
VRVNTFLTLTCENKGGIFENAIANIVSKNNRKLFYYKPYKSSSKDIEIVIESIRNIKLIEVKASNSRAKTLVNSINNKSYDIKLTNANIALNNNNLTLT